MASVSDKVTDVRNATRPVSTTVSNSRAAGGTSLSCVSLTGWPTASKVHFVTYQVDSNSNPVAGTQLDCYGIVSGNTINSFTVVDGSDNGNAVGDIVEMLPTAAWGQDLADALTQEHNRTGTHKNVTATSVSTGTLTVTSGSSFPAGDIATAELANGAVTLPKLTSGVAKRLGLNTKTSTGTVLTTSYVTYATVTATSTGGECEVNFGAIIRDGSSGANRNGLIKVQLDGADVTPTDLSWITNVSAGGGNTDYMVSSTPAAGSHTWTLQLKANSVSSSLLDQAYIRVQELS